jgi:hypothetical protein
MNQFRQPYSLTESFPGPHKHSLASERIVNSPLWWQNTIYNSTFPWEHLKCSRGNPIKIPSQYQSQLPYTPLPQLGFDRKPVRASFPRPFASVVMTVFVHLAKDHKKIRKTLKGHWFYYEFHAYSFASVFFSSSALCYTTHLLRSVFDNEDSKMTKFIAPTPQLVSVL